MNKYAVLILALLPVVPISANIASALIEGATEGVRAVLRRLDLPDTVSSRKFVQAIAALEEGGGDRGMKRRLLAVLREDEHSVHPDMDILGDLTRLAHRYGRSLKGSMDSIPYPSGDGVDEIVVFREPLSPGIREIASLHVPWQNRQSLTDILLRNLSKFWLTIPKRQQLDDISDEKLGLAVLMVRAFQFGDDGMVAFFESFFDELANRPSRNLFDPENRDIFGSAVDKLFEGFAPES